MTNKPETQIAQIFSMIALTALFICSTSSCSETPEKVKTISGTVTAAADGTILFMYSRITAGYPDGCTFTTDLPAPQDQFVVTINTGESTGIKVIEGLAEGKSVSWTATVDGKPLNQGSGNFVHIIN